MTPDIETHITSALGTQRMLASNDLLKIINAQERGESHSPEDMAAFHTRQGRIQALLYLLLILWGPKRYAAYCETAILADIDLPTDLARETEAYSDDTHECQIIPIPS